MLCIDSLRCSVCTGRPSPLCSFSVGTSIDPLSTPVATPVTSACSFTCPPISPCACQSDTERADLLWCMAYLSSSSAAEVISLLNANLFQLLVSVVRVPRAAVSFRLYRSYSRTWLSCASLTEPLVLNVCTHVYVCICVHVCVCVCVCVYVCVCVCV
jgi:hypothetical protein